MNIVKKRFNKSALALGVVSALCLGMSTSASAASFQWGDVRGTFDSTWTAGASWRVSDRDWSGQIGKVNQPQFDWSGYSAFGGAFGSTKYTSAEIWAQPGSYSSNNDLSNLLYAKGDTTSEIVKGLHELSLKYENYGLFLRGMYFYDRKLNDGDYGFNDPLTGKEFDPCADSKASEVQCKDIRLLDAFVYANWDLNDGANPLSVRVGNQVVSWGESTLISHGIAEINAVDLNILNAPGAELKEAFRPQGMVWASLGLSENLNLEAFYQYDWQPIWVPTPGSNFATNDFAGFGGYNQNAQLGFNSNPDMNQDFLISEYTRLYEAAAASGFNSAYAAYMTAYSTKAALVQDAADPSNDGQFGVKLGYYSPELGETEFGFYYMNYHSRRPLISGTASNFTTEAIGRDYGRLAQSGGVIDRDLLLSMETFTKSQIVYPEDIQLYGFSFNTLVGDTSVAGEISHRVDEPLQIDDVELLFLAMPQQLANAGIRPDLDGISQMDNVAPGETVDGYILTDTTQAQMTFTHLFGPTLGLDNLTMLAEVGGVWIHDMPGFDELRLNGPGTARSGGNPDMPGIIEALHNGPETNPFPTDFAWGYRLVAKADFNNVFAGVNMYPRVIFSHDVDGITPDPMFLFTEGRKSVALGVNFDYQSRWGADISYNSFFGGVGTTNAMTDRDYISFNVKYSI
ncbi:DUF1302 domain-containing protein [Shewanella sp. SR43-4]|mgnify:FL=1|uniref:DUF1302 domain-containing protein n=1 Tax=Shewanella TaxID=22 RepID=UPI000C41FB60|nr:MULTISPECIES: DUF1302 domain-containing protein [Shewanella]NCQ43698.1 DUF1302 domain-containing protein [Shewanella frigidimarina]MBB1316909.1 DUF1302 domain-containing protein [Shewanella sp. SR43-4]MBB1321787.1 DUF1302 domain-containing protein [Shewanella sp. SR43-8]MBB1390670.1 DUF1302 domain-containing protein [Shewanella sp. SG44-6]MBB1476648.1 DUF1302 domain-containing protein [Shewanella sp. SG41-3]|tara:strand:+ start:3225 stop:5273 length:2049 start_codon:yes stop_codon:yes gene_type:complete